MRKKKIISIMSSILFSFAFIGLFAIGIFVDDKQKVIETKADNILVNGYTAKFVNNSYISSNSNSVSVNCNFTIGVYRNLDEGSYRYKYSVNITNLYFQFADYTIRKYNGGYLSNFTDYSVVIDFDTNEVFTGIRIELLSIQAVSKGSSTDLRRLRLSWEVSYLTSDNTYYTGYHGSDNDIRGIRIADNGVWISDYSRYDNICEQIQQTNQTYLADTLYSLTMVNAYNTEDDIYTSGYQSGYNNGYNAGQTDGINQGYNQGYEAGKEQQSSDDEILINEAYQQGYTAGYEQANTQDQTVSTIFSGIMSVAMVPVDFFLAIFNFEILGINISAMVTALLSLAITIVVIKLVMGKKGD